MASHLGCRQHTKEMLRIRIRSNLIPQPKFFPRSQTTLKHMTATLLPRTFKCFMSTSINQWNYNIRTAVNLGETHKALSLFRQIKQLGLEPDNLTYPFISKACAKLSNPQYSQIIHPHVIKSRFMYDVYVSTAMVDMYIKCEKLDSACKLFDRMLERDVTSWNVMIMGVAHLGGLGDVMCLFRDMRLEELMPDAVTVIGLIQSSLKVKNLNMLRGVHCFGIKNGSYCHDSVRHTGIAAYAKSGDLGSAENVFYEIPIGGRTVISWNSMIAGYAHLRKPVNAIEVYKKMCWEGVRPDLSTMLSLLSSVVHPESLLQGCLIHCECIKMGYDSNVCVGNTLISMYSKCGKIDNARFLFNNMSERSCVSWTALIGGYAELGDVHEAFTLFHAMEATGERPDLVTVIALLNACGQTGSIGLGRWLDRYAISNGFGDSVMVRNALINMYSKCGSMSDAIEIFRDMPERTIVSWTTTITGYALNGQFNEALSLFYQMVELGLKPNHITSLAVLQACTHGGFLEEGQKFFTSMTAIYNLRPSLEHYSCMADLLGRKGKLEEALQFIQKMPMKPDAGVWGAFLGACKMYNNTNIGELIAHHLFNMEPKTAASYVAMANIYAAEGEWEDLAKVRALMKGNKIRKSPGRSLVQVNGTLHAFTVEDRSHPEWLWIYEVLDGFSLQLKAVELELYATSMLDV